MERRNRVRPRVYLISPPAFEPAIMADRLAAALEAGDVAALQVRLKDVPDDDVLAAVTRLMPVAHAADVAVIVNDKPALAKQADADGVHIGQSDATLAEARRILGPGKEIGVTCHNSRHLAFEAGEAGADYVAFGAFFPTETKMPPTMADPELIADWAEIAEIPCVAIGGITAENCAPLVKAGADFLAVSGFVWHHSDGPPAAVKAINEAIDAAFEP